MKKIVKKIEDNIQKLPRYFQIMTGLFLSLNIAGYLAMREISDILMSSSSGGSSQAEVAKLSAHDFINYSNSVFFLDTAKNLMMLIFIVAIVTIALQVLIKFRLKLPRLLSALLISLFVGMLLLVLSSLVFDFKVEFLVFAVVFAGTMTALMASEIKKRLTAYDMGERI
ncbi:MAG: hypothetical protein LBI13_03330 [Streptococcaceae bacterium]|jgi:hypothetical protein|nr:hypothetical protein [Streptococcaceae bacterium]